MKNNIFVGKIPCKSIIECEETPCRMEELNSIVSESGEFLHISSFKNPLFPYM